MRTFLHKVPFPFLGYVFFLIGFAGLGFTLALLASGTTTAGAALAVATVLAYALGAGCFAVRRFQIDHADPADPLVLGMEPLEGDTDRREVGHYLQEHGRPVPEHRTAPRIAA